MCLEPSRSLSAARINPKPKKIFVLFFFVFVFFVFFSLVFFLLNFNFCNKYSFALRLFAASPATPSLLLPKVREGRQNETEGGKITKIAISHSVVLAPRLPHAATTPQTRSACNNRADLLPPEEHRERQWGISRGLTRTTIMRMLHWAPGNTTSLWPVVSRNLAFVVRGTNLREGLLTIPPPATLPTLHLA